MTVGFSADESVVLTEGTRAVIRYDDLIGGRYLSLMEGAGGTKKLNPGDTIPMAQTQPALDLDALDRWFPAVVPGRNPDEVNQLSGQLISTRRAGATSVVPPQTASLTNTLADRGPADRRGDRQPSTRCWVRLPDKAISLGKGVDAVSELVTALFERRTDITNSLAYTNVRRQHRRSADPGRPPLQTVVKEADRTAGIVVADHDYWTT